MKTLKPLLESDFYDNNINVFDLENGKYLVRDSKENIQFECTELTLSTYEFIDDDTFFADILFDKLNAQNQFMLEKHDKIYQDRLWCELERIVNHCENSYNEFMNDVYEWQASEAGLILKNVKINKRYKKSEHFPLF